jgi:hypothetical protein
MQCTFKEVQPTLFRLAGAGANYFQMGAISFLRRRKALVQITFKKVQSAFTKR